MTVYTGALDGRPACGKMLQSSRCQGCGHLPTWVESEMPSRHVRCLTLASSEIYGFYRTFPSRQSNKAQVLPVPMLSGDMTPPPCHPISCWPLSGLDRCPQLRAYPLGSGTAPQSPAGSHTLPSCALCHSCSSQSLAMFHWLEGVHFPSSTPCPDPRCSPSPPHPPEVILSHHVHPTVHSLLLFADCFLCVHQSIPGRWCPP